MLQNDTYSEQDGSWEHKRGKRQYSAWNIKHIQKNIIGCIEKTKWCRLSDSRFIQLAVVAQQEEGMSFI